MQAFDMSTYKMTFEQVEALREAQACGVSRADLAAAYEISLSGVDHIVAGRSWNGSRVPNAALRQAVLESGVSCSEIARRLGWTRMKNGRTAADESRVRRDLGLRTARGGGYTTVQQYAIGYEKAVAIARAINVDPVDLGL